MCHPVNGTHFFGFSFVRAVVSPGESVKLYNRLCAKSHSTRKKAEKKVTAADLRCDFGTALVAHLCTVKSALRLCHGQKDSKHETRKSRRCVFYYDRVIIRYLYFRNSMAVRIGTLLYRLVGCFFELDDCVLRNVLSLTNSSTGRSIRIYCVRK